MTMKRIAIVTLACLWLNINDAEGQCRAPPARTGAEFPDLFKSGDFMYSMEVSMTDSKETLYFTECYNKTLARGRYDLKFEGVDWKMILFHDTQELFSVKKHSCATHNITELKKNDDAKKDLWPNEWLFAHEYIGPGLWAEIFHKDKTANSGPGLMDGKKLIRGVNTNHWVFCHDDDRMSEIFITDPITDPALGLVNQPVPVRVIGSKDGGKTIVHYTEFIGFQRVLPPQQHLLFSIPTQVGCKRLKTGLKEMPTYSKDVYYEAEVVYQPLNSQIHYVSVLSVAVHHETQHVAVQSTPWIKNNGSDIVPGPEMFRVYDMKSKFVYEIDKTIDKCRIRKLQEAQPTLDFPDGSKLNVLDPDIFITGTPSTEFHYLGEAETRGIYTNVFEKTITDENGFEQAISTRYHLADEITLNVDFAEKSAPVQIVYQNMSPKTIRENFTGQVMVNIFAFQNRLVHSNQKFDVSLCFAEDSQSKWFQLVFPLKGKSANDVVLRIPFIEDNFFLILSPQLDASPLRFPVIKVDVDADNIYVTGRILDRPPLLNKFKSTVGLAIDPKSATQQGMLTLEECAKSCFKTKTCKRFSHCGAMCDIDKTDSSASISKDGCALLEDVTPEDSLPTMEDLANQIAATLQSSPRLTLSFPDASLNPMEFTASKFKFGSGFGLGKLGDTDQDVLDDRLSVFLYGYKFDPSEADVSGRNLVEKSLVSCQRDCLLSSECMALSYCKASKSCFLSRNHPKDMTASHVLQDTQCIIYHRDFLQYFNEYKGLVLARSAHKMMNVDLEDCAHQCILDPKNCRSFDHCPQETFRKCLLHKVHLVEVDEEQVNIESVCGHYSRTYVMDFEKKWHEELTEGLEVQIANTTAETCAATCSGAVNCKGFNHCVNFASQSSVCQIQTASSTKTKPSTTCTAFIRN